MGKEGEGYKNKMDIHFQKTETGRTSRSTIQFYGVTTLALIKYTKSFLNGKKLRGGLKKNVNLGILPKYLVGTLNLCFKMPDNMQKTRD